MTKHPSLSVSGLCFPGLSAAQVLAEVATIGVSHTTLSAGLLDADSAAGLRAQGESIGVDVRALIGRTIPALDQPATWADKQAQLMRDLDLARAVGASAVYMLTGSRNQSPWTEAVEQFASFISPCIDYAGEAGVKIAVEPANVLYADFTFVHTFASATALARQIPGLTICLDLFHTWTEPNLKADIETSAALISLVQVGDYAYGDRSLPSRAVPGDGAIPIADIVGWVVDAGYEGVIDLELNGPRIDAEGHRSASQRGAEVLDGVLRSKPAPRSKG